MDESDGLENRRRAYQGVRPGPLTPQFTPRLYHYVRLDAQSNLKFGLRFGL